jgi:putative tryptophan/tyrosine transport system substrate-binding protein
MKRRAFITVLGGAVIAWPLAARAQQPGMPVIGFLSARAPDESKHLVAAFRRGLGENGYIEGETVAIDYRWALSKYDQLPAMANEFARRPVAVLVAFGGDVAARAAAAATRTVPIVTAFGIDPVGSGLIASYNRPGGNVTGVSNLSATIEPKRLGLLRELTPGAATVGALVNPNNPTAAIQRKEIDEAARVIGVQLHYFQASIERELEAAFEAIAQDGIPALLVAADAFFTSSRAKLAALAARHAVPTMYYFRDFAVAGGLMSYGSDLADQYRLVGVYAGRILKGAKPADLPVLQPTKFEFVINLKAANSLGVKFSPDLLSLADEVIE